MATSLKVGDTVRVTGESWCTGIGSYRAVIRSIFNYGEKPYTTRFARIAWRGRNAHKLAEQYGERFELANLRKA